MRLRGIGASEGVAIARLWRLHAPDLTVPRREGCDPAMESGRFAAAREQAGRELAALYEKALVSDPDSAMIFDLHQLMLEDPDLCEGTEARITAGHNAEWAISETADGLRAMFEAMEDEYMRGRAADVQDVANRLVRILKGLPEGEEMPAEPVIVAAEDLLPSQTVKLDRRYVAGCVTQNGSLTSHSAILARSMGIPCVVGLGEDYARLPGEGTVILDGGAGAVVACPTQAELAEYAAKQAALGEEKRLLEGYFHTESITRSGHKCLVCANIGSVEEAEAAAKSGAEGVGLFRSEFLYLDSPDFPPEEKQFQVYRRVLEVMSPRQVVIRTLDLGSDKQAPYFNIPGEENPAMGYRAIRICLDRPEIFRTQLRALFRASVYGKLRVMFPMITGVGQVREIKGHIAAVKAELDAQGVPYADDIQLGVMIETPAAAIMSDELAREVDFFSIGTNDLTQYTMAADRMNARVSHIFNAEDPAVLRMIEIVAQNAHAAGIWVGVCGEAGANTRLTPFFMRNRIEELSVAASSILKVRRAVCESED